MYKYYTKVTNNVSDRTGYNTEVNGGSECFIVSRPSRPAVDSTDHVQSSLLKTYRSGYTEDIAPSPPSFHVLYVSLVWRLSRQAILHNMAFHTRYISTPLSLLLLFMFFYSLSPSMFFWYYWAILHIYIYQLYTCTKIELHLAIHLLTFWGGYLCVYLIIHLLIIYLLYIYFPSTL